jgi:hypothetical protein
MDSIDHHKKGTRIAIGATIGCVGIVIVFMIILLWGISRTGLVRVPVFSLGFEAPEPTRIVEPTNFTESLEDIFTESLKASLTTGELTLSLTDSMLTSLLRETFENEEVPEFLDPTSAQVAALSDGSLELYVPLQNKELKTAAIIQVIPSIDSNGQAVVEIERLSIGKLNAPGVSHSAELEVFVSDFIDGMLQESQEMGRIKSIKVEEGVLHISGEMN